MPYCTFNRSNFVVLLNSRTVDIFADTRSLMALFSAHNRSVRETCPFNILTRRYVEVTSRTRSHDSHVTAGGDGIEHDARLQATNTGRSFGLATSYICRVKG